MNEVGAAVTEMLLLLSIARLSGADTPPPVPGVDTVMLATPELLMSDAVTAAVNCVGLT